MQQQPSNNTVFLEQSELYFGFLRRVAAAGCDGRCGAPV